jgi:hypothetical protein
MSVASQVLVVSVVWNNLIQDKWLIENFAHYDAIVRSLGSQEALR